MTTSEEQGTAHTPPLTISRFMLGSAITSAIAFGAIGGMIVLFMADAFFDVGEDPAVHQEVQQVDARVAALEAKLRENNPQTQNNDFVTKEIQSLKDTYAMTVAETQALKAEVAKAYQSSGADERLAQAMIGLTQIKNASDHDYSLRPGIETLQKAFPTGSVHDKLEELKTLTEEKLPSKKELLSDLDAYRHQSENPNTVPATTDPQAQKDLTWKDRATIAFKQVVDIRPTAEVADNETLQQIRQAVAGSNFKLAHALSDKLPAGPETQILRAKLAIRAKAQSSVNTIINSVSSALGQGPRGSLY